VVFKQKCKIIIVYAKVSRHVKNMVGFFAQRIKVSLIQK
jgi:hypothetical protein